MPKEILLHGKVLRNYSKHDSLCLTLQTSIFYPTQKKENTSSPAIIKTRPEFDMLTLQYLFLMTCHIICKIWYILLLTSASRKGGFNRKGDFN